ncbi:hypothetical protein Zmor_002119 [Zophobas morio]|uniref:Ricin B lectin domain-containing protein n=1 Tax=Zophobas morio TaxID=2755281 RepID=A0AA38J3S4_9CUCU|nr:hypothetical protein Zmor_002119 [Zophobas morio]
MSYCQTDRYLVIRNQKSGLVLDASEYLVKLQYFMGFPPQLWKLESAGLGTFFIVNKGNGQALDIQGEANNGNNLITYAKHGGITQQWFINSDGTIVSAVGDWAINICQSSYFAGNTIIAYNKHGGPNQKFHLQYE